MSSDKPGYVNNVNLSRIYVTLSHTGTCTFVCLLKQQKVKKGLPVLDSKVAVIYLQATVKGRHKKTDERDCILIEDKTSRPVKLIHKTLEYD